MVLSLKLAERAFKIIMGVALFTKWMNGGVHGILWVGV